MIHPMLMTEPPILTHPRYTAELIHLKCFQWQHPRCNVITIQNISKPEFHSEGRKTKINLKKKICWIAWERKIDKRLTLSSNTFYIVSEAIKFPVIGDMYQFEWTMCRICFKIIRCWGGRHERLSCECWSWVGDPLYFAIFVNISAVLYKDI